MSLQHFVTHFILGDGLFVFIFYASPPLFFFLIQFLYYPAGHVHHCNSNVNHDGITNLTLNFETFFYFSVVRCIILKWKGAMTMAFLSCQCKIKQPQKTVRPRKQVTSICGLLFLELLFGILFLPVLIFNNCNLDLVYHFKTETVRLISRHLIFYVCACIPCCGWRQSKKYTVLTNLMAASVSHVSLQLNL